MAGGRYSRFSPIWGNEAFVPGRADGGFKLWAGKGIKQLKYVFGKNKTLLSFEELMAKFYIPRTHLLNFFQLRDFIKVKQAQSLTIPSSSVDNRKSSHQESL